MEKCYFCSRKKDVAEIIGKTRNDGACKFYQQKYRVPCLTTRALYRAPFSNTAAKIQRIFYLTKLFAQLFISNSLKMDLLRISKKPVPHKYRLLGVINLLYTVK